MPTNLVVDATEKYRWPFEASIRVDSITARSHRDAIKCRGYRSHAVSGNAGMIKSPAKILLFISTNQFADSRRPLCRIFGAAAIKVTMFAVYRFGARGRPWVMVAKDTAGAKLCDPHR